MLGRAAGVGGVERCCPGGGVRDVGAGSVGCGERC